MASSSPKSTGARTIIGIILLLLSLSVAWVNNGTFATIAILGITIPIGTAILVGIGSLVLLLIRQISEIKISRSVVLIPYLFCLLCVTATILALLLASKNVDIGIGPFVALSGLLIVISEELIPFENIGKKLKKRRSYDSPMSVTGYGKTKESATYTPKRIIE